VNKSQLKSFLDKKVDQYNQLSFIETDPISIPHQFDPKQDIEIMGFWTAMLAWGQRITIINKANELIQLMDGAPYDFIKNHEEKDRKRFLEFKHRTFNTTDTLYFLEFFQHYYSKNESLEDAFFDAMSPEDETIENGLIGFQELFFRLPNAPERTRKHIASPQRKSTCKRLSMFLRWMVRSDSAGVDFGIWNNIKPSQLTMPLDVHVERVARQLNLIKRKQRDWQTTLELTKALSELDADDPVKYDYALFGLGVFEGYGR